MTYFVDTYSRVDMPPVTELRRASDGKRILELERRQISASCTKAGVASARVVSWPRVATARPTSTASSSGRRTSIRHKKYPVIERHLRRTAGLVRAQVVSGHSTAMQAHGRTRLHRRPDRRHGHVEPIEDVPRCVPGRTSATPVSPIAFSGSRRSRRSTPTMDITRVGIYGGSAGGQNAMGGLLFHGDFYKVAVSDCGCHDNRMDKIWWNEQWMGWPIGPHYEASLQRRHTPIGSRASCCWSSESWITNVDPASTMQVVNAADQGTTRILICWWSPAASTAPGAPVKRAHTESQACRLLRAPSAGREPAAVVGARDMDANQHFGARLLSVAKLSVGASR